MNIVRSFTWKSLRANRTRTIMTVIGIILSMVLFTSVLEGAYSGQQFIIRSIEEEEGTWMVSIPELTGQEAKDLRSSSAIRDSAVLETVGWGEIGSENEYKPYLFVESFDPDIEDLLKIHLVSGRMPENEGEILLPGHLQLSGGVTYSVGDTFTVDLGKRTDDSGRALTPNAALRDEGETITDAQEHTYTVTGIYRRFDTRVESFDSPGFTALTRGGSGQGSYTLYASLVNAGDAEKWVIENGLMEKAAFHSDLIQAYGTFFNWNLASVLYGFAAVLIFLIAFGSIALIYNSFSISVSERTKQFGILKSVGATKKQIKRSVLYEALILALFGIPAGMVLGCGAIGFVLWCFRDGFKGYLFADNETQMKLVLNPFILLAAAVICLVTVFIAAWIPAKRAIRVLPIESIRQSNDVREFRKPKKTIRRGVFGFEASLASRYFGRSKKRYRATVASLFMSIVLFIAASSFCAYLTTSVKGITRFSDDADITYYYAGDDELSPEELLEILDVPGVTEGAYNAAVGLFTKIPAELTDESFYALAGTTRAENESYPVSYNPNIVFLQDEKFKELCQNNGYDPEVFFDSDAKRCLVWNSFVGDYSNGSGSRKWMEYSVLDESKIPTELRLIKEKDIEGYYYTGFDDEGLIYVPFNDDGVPDWEKQVIFPYEEAAYLIDIEVQGVIKKPGFGIYTGVMALVLPYSRLEKFPDLNIYTTEFCFRAPDHAAVFKEMEKAVAAAGLDTSRLYDDAKEREQTDLFVTVINVFAYCFIILISLIALLNVFNTISTNVILRRREFAMLRSVGMSDRQMKKMMNYECLIYGLRSILFGLPAAILLTFVIWQITGMAYDMNFYVPWYSIAIAIGSVFLVVFGTMLYAMSKLKKENVVEALRADSI